MRSFHARQRPPHRAEAEVIEGPHRSHPRGLGHAPALEHGHPRRVEEFEDLRADGGRSGDRLAHLAAEQVTHAREDALVGPGKGARGLGGDLLTALAPAAHVDSQRDRLVKALAVGVGGVGQRRHGQRVELLEEAGHRRDVGRMGCLDLGDHPLGVAAEVDNRRPGVKGPELDGEGEHVSQRQVEVADIAGSHEPELLHHRAHRHGVCVSEHAALGRSGGARGVDEGVGVLGADRGAPAGQLVGRPRAPAPITQPVEVDPFTTGLDGDDVLEGGEALAHLLDLGQLGGVLTHHRPGLGVTGHPFALLRGVGGIDGHHHGAHRGDGKADERPLDAGVGKDAHPVAGVDAQLDEPQGELVDDRGDRGEAQLALLRVGVRAHGHAVAVAGGGRGRQAGHRRGDVLLDILFRGGVLLCLTHLHLPLALVVGAVVR